MKHLTLLNDRSGTQPADEKPTACCNWVENPPCPTHDVCVVGSPACWPPGTVGSEIYPCP